MEGFVEGSYVPNGKPKLVCKLLKSLEGLKQSPIARGTSCPGHVVPGARPCALGTFSYLVTSTSYFRLSYPNRLL